MILVWWWMLCLQHLGSTIKNSFYSRCTHAKYKNTWSIFLRRCSQTFGHNNVFRNTQTINRRNIHTTFTASSTLGILQAVTLCYLSERKWIWMRVKMPADGNTPENFLSYRNLAKSKRHGLLIHPSRMSSACIAFCTPMYKEKQQRNTTGFLMVLRCWRRDIRHHYRNVIELTSVVPVSGILSRSRERCLPVLVLCSLTCESSYLLGCHLRP